MATQAATGLTAPKCRSDAEQNRHHARLVTGEVWQQVGHGIETSVDTVGHRAAHLAGFDPHEPPPVLLGTFEAETYLEAMAQFHEYMEWEPYRPMEGVD